jgi:hypothetical protein
MVDDDEDDALPEIVMFFLGPDGELLDDETTPQPRTVGEVVREWKTTLEAERQHPGSRRNRPDTRRVEGTGRLGRPGFRDEVLVTLRSNPVLAVTEAIRGDLFVPPIARLTVDGTSLEVDRYELNWQAVLRVFPWQKRSVRLRLYASPSLNVSVLSLIPPQQRSAAKSSFLRVGLKAMTQLRDQLDERVDRTAAAAREQ